jgi:hypothetical protein
MACGRWRWYRTGMSSTSMTVAVGRHMVSIERLEQLRWRVSVDGQRFATFCSESRARAAGRLEARRLDLTALPATAAARGLSGRHG